ncbi:MAG TPA: thioredoxin domain-containing protein [Geobacteraceae bacterium]
MENGTSHRDVGAHLRRLIEMDKSALPPDGGERFNRLIFATSPYLLQHAENPVAWYPWGEEAFARAAAEDKPLFLSIGYATCHWCHVMAHESFEDREVAEVLNRHFVAIKVDREERPDIDDQYMAVAQMMTGGGGWPLQVIMTPDRQPFFTVTYLPKHGRGGMPGLIELLEQLAELWRTRRDVVLKNCAAVFQSLSTRSIPAPGELDEGEIFEQAYAQINQLYDPVYGGFGGAPKFPMPLYATFLLRHGKRTGSGDALRMVDHSLRMMRQGGICDQLGFGFHRYAVDRQWLVPHFEKMLYDQALISLAFLEAFQTTGDRFHLRCAEEIFTYLLWEMAAPEGGFYSGQDADTEGEEGKYYVWTPPRVAEILGEQDARLFCRLFDVTARGNFEGANILHLPVSIEEFAGQEGMLPELLRADVERWRELLLAAREQRIRPLRDEKVLTAWNGLAIAALARGGAATGDERWLTAARRAASFVREKLVSPDGRLMRSHHLGRASVPAFLEDYAFCVWGLIELYEATLDAAPLDEARRLAGEMLRLFGGAGGGGLFETGSDAEQLPVRSRSAYDGVIPSGNSVAAMDLLRLGRILDDQVLGKAGESILRGFMGGVARQPAGHLHFLVAYDFFRGPEVEITLVGPTEAEETKAMLRAVKGRFIPNLVLGHEAGEGPGAVARVCAKGACRPPVQSAEELERLLGEVS